MRQRIVSMLQAVQIVRPALERFYQSLSDEQKERFIALEGEAAPGAARTANRQQPNLTQTCGGSSKPITGLPINQMRQVLRPNDVQQAALDELNSATVQAASLLKESCAQDAQDRPITPPGRLAAMEARLNALLTAIDTVQPAMAKFYNSLTDEQKARFDAMGAATAGAATAGATTADAATAGQGRRNQPPAEGGNPQAACGSNVTAWPADKIDRVVQPNRRTAGEARRAAIGRRTGR
jgi:hypothetical protein